MKLALPPIVWFQGIQSSTRGRGSPGWRGRDCWPIVTLAHIICCVLITALGVPVEPDVSRNLPTVCGSIKATEASTAAPAVVATRLDQAMLGKPGTGSSTCTSVTPRRSSALSARSYWRAFCTSTTAGCSSSNTYFSVP